MQFPGGKNYIAVAATDVWGTPRSEVWLVGATAEACQHAEVSENQHIEVDGLIVSDQMGVAAVSSRVAFDAKLGLAGHSFMTGAIINVEDAYKDPRFNRDVDDITGYRTRSVLTMPVTARDGRRIGVMQALNRRDAKSFDTADIARMSAFAAQAAIAIDNATLFSEVVSARNYNESILRSMSNGVITFDSDTHIAKVNAAAAAIFPWRGQLSTPRAGVEPTPQAGRSRWLQLQGIRK